MMQPKNDPSVSAIEAQLSKLQKAINVVGGYLDHLASCEIDYTEFCTCGLREAKEAFNTGFLCLTADHAQQTIYLETANHQLTWLLKSLAPDVEPLSTPMGLSTQISNAICGLRADHAQQGKEEDRLALRAHLDGVTVTSENIGHIRRSLFMPFDSHWNSLVREETAKRENQP